MGNQLIFTCCFWITPPIQPSEQDEQQFLVSFFYTWESQTESIYSLLDAEVRFDML